MSDDAFVGLLESGTLSTRICRGELVLGDGAAKTYDSRPALIAGGCRFHRPSATWRRSATDAHRAAIAKARAGSKGGVEARAQQRRRERTEAEEARMGRETTRDVPVGLEAVARASCLFECLSNGCSGCALDDSTGCR